ncbi:imm11 family protein [Dysgonomonas sp. 25]|uniref:imm11 family protein n=1 Tax=Dysgonomonas sp. 25 TaxID=2302933 RepID=UPI0013D5FB6C|nr:DUF1629 domain-containing protein [Dysgonomonas sp. 25]NDV69165.1 hypothetical protein [Dysgonomonas sp. 25]
METNLLYYIIQPEDSNFYPRLRAEKNEDYEYENAFIEKAGTIEYSLDKPAPNQPIMVDYHASPYSVFSDKVADVLKAMKIAGTQLIPAKVVWEDGTEFAHYRLLNVYNILSVLDMDKSHYRWHRASKVANPLLDIVLKEDCLSAIPLEKRLIFRLAENSTFELYHQSVVDAIRATKPDGIEFIKVEDWDYRP